ncbi:MAG TPA: SDR family oxidoreductase [Gaiellaceae bacterium]|nr:SDR family oxidoreductase [Gaiellaceae bacterium]
MAELSGEHVLVTGGARGIGAAIVEVALERGAAAVSFVDLDEEGGARRAAQLGERCSFLPADVTDRAQVVEAVAQLAGRHGPVTALVNNAGRNAYGDPATFTEAEWDDFFAIDLKAAWLVSQAVLPGMKEAGRGAIVNIASAHATATAPGMFPYAAAKSGIVGLTRSMALELGPHGIRVVAVSPGYTKTEAVRAWLDEIGLEEEIAAAHPLRRLGETREIAEVVAFALSSRASFASGVEWRVDGGLLARFAY